MPNVGWTVEQQAAIKRYWLFTNILTVVGVILSIAFIISGNTGGWIVLAMIACIYGACFLFIRNKAKSQP